MKSLLFAALAILLTSCLTLAGSLAGEWDFVAEESDGEVYDLKMVISEAEGKLSGTLGNYDGSTPLDRLALDQNKLTFELTTPEGVTYSAELVIDGSEMKGTFKGSNGSSGSIHAKRASP